MTIAPTVVALLLNLTPRSRSCPAMTTAPLCA